MSWIEKIENTAFTITTGDGSVFTPLWKNGETEKEFNVSVYDFINLAGSLIDRKLVKARSFPLLFWFSGADNIDQAAAFDLAANDPRAWVVKHPFYGTLTGQPMRIRRNDLNYNTTEISVEFWETMGGVQPVFETSVDDQLYDTVQGNLATVSPVNYGSKVNLKPIDASNIANESVLIDLNITKLIDADSYNDYQLVRQTMFAGVDAILTAPITAMQGIHQAILLATGFQIPVTERLNLMTALYNDAKQLVVSAFTRNNKAYFESVGAICIGGIGLAMVNPIAGDYVTRRDVQSASALLNSTYEDYLVLLDSAYLAITDPLNNFAASNETQTALQSSVVQTLSGLNALVFNAKQERVISLEKDSNLILLTHKYMGLDPDDVNLETFRQINKIKNKRLFNVKKGSQITYYV